MLLLILFGWNTTELIYSYRLFKKKQLLFDDRFTETMGMAITWMSSFSLALYMELMLPLDNRIVYLLPILVGLFIGWKFGTISKAPAALSGIYNGTMGGIMGMMLGAVLKNPALCKIPIESELMIATNMYSLSIFVACLHTLISYFFRYSLKA